jgi:O-antigen/teichoic acid export membrane protein
MLSAVSHKHPMIKNRSMLKKSLLLTAVLSGSTTLFFCVFPTFTLHTLLGPRYDVYANLLPILSLAIFIASVSNLLSTYLIALHRYVAIVPVILGTVVTVASILIAHTTIYQVIVGLLIGNIVMSIGLGIISFWPKYPLSVRRRS